MESISQETYNVSCCIYTICGYGYSEEKQQAVIIKSAPAKHTSWFTQSWVISKTGISVISTVQSSVSTLYPVEHHYNLKDFVHPELFKS